LILEIALGIVLAYLILLFLPVILIVAGYLLLSGLALLAIFLAYGALMEYSQESCGSVITEAKRELAAGTQSFQSPSGLPVTIITKEGQAAKERLERAEQGIGCTNWK
jgi:hypothetical protein